MRGDASDVAASSRKLPSLGSRSLRLGLLIAALFAAMTGFDAGAAFASTAEVTGATLTSLTLNYTAASGESNQVSITPRLSPPPLFRQGYLIADGGTTGSGSSITITPGALCDSISTSQAECFPPLGGSITRLAVRAGDLGDSASTSVPTPSAIWGGSGDDVLTGGAGDDVIYGEGGNDIIGGNAGNDFLRGGQDRPFNLLPFDGDTIDGGPGDDRLFGGADRDVLIGGPGPTPSSTDADSLQGESGIDDVDYTARTAGVTVYLYDTFASGVSGENDRIDADVENAAGGSGNDFLEGNNYSDNVLTGGDGNDTLSGAMGNDILNGGRGDDQLDPFLSGSEGNDTLNGGPDNDRLFGGHGSTASDTDSDLLRGAGGVDLADYSQRTIYQVYASLNDSPDDGFVPNEHDNIRSDVENVTTGSGFDRLTGNASANVLIGRDGNDQIYGEGGSDQLLGQDGDDFIFSRNDNVADLVYCGNGVDTVDADALDQVAADCENVTIAP